VFVKSGGVWSQQAKIVAPSSRQAYQGMSVSLSTSGDLLAIGASNDAGCKYPASCLCACIMPSSISTISIPKFHDHVFLPDFLF
jgi:hypothetical protein